MRHTYLTGNPRTQAFPRLNSQHQLNKLRLATRIRFGEMEAASRWCYRCRKSMSPFSTPSFVVSLLVVIGLCVACGSRHHARQARTGDAVGCSDDEVIVYDIDGNSWNAECKGISYFCSAESWSTGTHIIERGTCTRTGYDEHWASRLGYERAIKLLDRGKFEEGEAILVGIKKAYPNSPHLSKVEQAIHSIPRRQARGEEQRWSRKGWFSSLGYGPSIGTGEKVSGTAQINIPGWAFSPEFALSMGLMVTNELGPLPNKTDDINTLHIDVNAYWYFYKNLYLKLGAGLAGSRHSINDDDEKSANGVSLVGGAGYEHRLFPWLALFAEAETIYAGTQEHENFRPTLMLGTNFYLWRGAGPCCKDDSTAH